jgi:pimeloyl-ACP methyl ester carboxylesterase
LTADSFLSPLAARKKENKRYGSQTMTFSQERIEDGGVVRRSFELDVDGEPVPAVIWAPEGATGPRPLMLMGHGGSQHKKTPTLTARARQYARKFGYATLAIDAPGHGDRISREEAVALARDVGARVRGETAAPMDADRMRQMLRRSGKAVPEWQAALDMAQTFDFVGAGGPVGYWGVSMGTAIGVPFVAAEPRITAAIFGLAGLREGAADMEAAAKSITIPLMFVFQWEDAVAPRETGIALFNAFGSTEKTMHINPGGHMDIPAFEGHDWEAFYVRHLGTADAPARAGEVLAAE